MARVLLLFAHPLLEKSRVHVELLKIAGTIKGVTVNDLYENYPEFDIDLPREKELLLNNDIVIFQHPFYWYSAPPILKQWQDVVLEHNWAYGKKGFALAGKKAFNIFTSGAGEETYNENGFNKYPIQQFLRPFERTIELCNMSYWPPFWISGVHRIDPAGIKIYAEKYKALLLSLTNDLYDEKEIKSHSFMNDLFSTTSTNF